MQAYLGSGPTKNSGTGPLPFTTKFDNSASTSSEGNSLAGTRSEPVAATKKGNRSAIQTKFGSLLRHWGT